MDSRLYTVRKFSVIPSVFLGCPVLAILSPAVLSQLFCASCPASAILSMALLMLLSLALLSYPGLSSFFCPCSPYRAVLSGWPVPALLFLWSCSQMPYHDCPATVVPSSLCPVFLILSVMFWPFCLLFPFLAVLSWRSSAVLSCLPYTFPIREHFHVRISEVGRSNPPHPRPTGDNVMTIVTFRPPPTVQTKTSLGMPWRLVTKCTHFASEQKWTSCHTGVKVSQ